MDKPMTLENRPADPEDDSSARRLIAHQEEKLRLMTQDLERFRSQAMRRDEEIAALRRQLQELERANAYFATSSLESRIIKIANGWPRSTRIARRIAKLAWWTVTLQLIARLRTVVARRSQQR
jgi:hypothetical protein